MMDDSKYIPFHLASQALASRLGATPEEISLWAWLGKHHGGLNPFRSSRPAPYGDAQMPLPLNPPTHDQVSAGEGSSLWLAGAYFRKADIEGFDPAAAGRFISWPDLVARWEARGLSADEVLMKVRSLVASDQIDEPVAPIFGASDGLAPQDWAMFRREQIEAIEDHEFPTDGDASATSGAAIAGNLIAAIPGKMPRVSIGKLAVTAAWEIESKSKLTATADEVIKQLQTWATDGKYPDVLLRSEPKKHAVIWATKKTGAEKDYDVDACGKTIGEWRKSRAQGESRNVRERVGTPGM